MSTSSPSRSLRAVPERCAWVPESDPLYVAYHDEEWGVPERDDRALYELLTLEGAQAGLLVDDPAQARGLPSRLRGVRPGQGRAQRAP